MFTGARSGTLQLPVNVRCAPLTSPGCFVVSNKVAAPIGTASSPHSPPFSILKNPKNNSGTFRQPGNSGTTTRRELGQWSEPEHDELGAVAPHLSDVLAVAWLQTWVGSLRGCKKLGGSRRRVAHQDSNPPTP